MMLNSNMKILVIDDFSTMRRIVKSLLKELGYLNVEEADDGSTAWPMIQKNQYDLIISDWNMPEMTGVDLLKKVRQTSNLKKTPFLLITAEAKHCQMLDAIDSGVDGYILKPFTAAILDSKIQNIFNRLAALSSSAS